MSERHDNKSKSHIEKKRSYRVYPENLLLTVHLKLIKIFVVLDQFAQKSMVISEIQKKFSMTRIVLFLELLSER
jgi:hypothetical protein